MKPQVSAKSGYSQCLNTLGLPACVKSSEVKVKLKGGGADRNFHGIEGLGTHPQCHFYPSTHGTTPRVARKRPAWPGDPLFGYFEAFPSFAVWLEATVAWINDVFIRADDGTDGGYSR